MHAVSFINRKDVEICVKIYSKGLKFYYSYISLLSKKYKLSLLKNIHIQTVTCFGYKGVCGMTNNRTEGFMSLVSSSAPNAYL